MLQVLFEVPIEGSGSLTVAVPFLSCLYCVLRCCWLGSACTRCQVQFLKVLLDHSIVSCCRHIIQAQFSVMLDVPVDVFHWLLRFQVQFIKVLMDLSWIMPVLSF